MAFIWIEVVADEEHTSKLRDMASDAGASEIVTGPLEGEGRRTTRILAGEIDRQALIDDIQSMLKGSGDWRIVLSGTLAVVPHTEEEDKRQAEKEEKERKQKISTSREELYQSVKKGASLDLNYALLVLLSTVVAAIGLINDNVAVLIGAMVIAPLLGPNLALAFGITIGDRDLVLKALLTSVAGLVLAIGLAMLAPILVEVDLGQGELAARTTVNYDSIALALASGAAASLSLTTGLSATLVGVMVAVALLPPAATLGIAFSEGEAAAAGGAALLLAVNIVSVNLASNVVFLLKGIRPHSWWERKGARQSVRVTIMALSATLVILAGLIWMSRSELF